VEEKLNFSEISALVMDGDRYSTSIIGQILHGFWLTRHTTVDSVEDAKRLLSAGVFHLLITETNLADSALNDFVYWIRRSAKNELRYIPIVVLTGYIFYSRVAVARDAGVNSVVRKPVSPTILFDHIAWSAHTDRPFIDADGYAGRCRRFRFNEPAPGFIRRMSDRPPGGSFDRRPEPELPATEEVPLQ
jgi:CheY-like chemotaxis protein